MIKCNRDEIALPIHISVVEYAPGTVSRQCIAFETVRLYA